MREGKTAAVDLDSASDGEEALCPDRGAQRLASGGGKRLFVWEGDGDQRDLHAQREDRISSCVTRYAMLRLRFSSFALFYRSGRTLGKRGKMCYTLSGE